MYGDRYSGYSISHGEHVLCRDIFRRFKNRLKMTSRDNHDCILKRVDGFTFRDYKGTYTHTPACGTAVGIIIHDDSNDCYSIVLFHVCIRAHTHIHTHECSAWFIVIQRLVANDCSSGEKYGQASTYGRRNGGAIPAG